MDSHEGYSIERCLESMELVLRLASFFKGHCNQVHPTLEIMSSLFCCDSVQSYRPQILSHEQKFRMFMLWAKYPRNSVISTVAVDLLSLKPDFAVQLVRQVNYGPLESKRYFIPSSSSDGGFLEISENDLIQANFQKLNA